MHYSLSVLQCWWVDPPFLFVSAANYTASNTRKTTPLACLAQNYSNSSANVLELLQSCTKPSIYHHPAVSPFTTKLRPCNSLAHRCQRGSACRRWEVLIDFIDVLVGLGQVHEQLSPSQFIFYANHVSYNVYTLARNFRICRTGTPVVRCAKLCIDYWVALWVRANQNSHPIWCTSETFFVKHSPGRGKYANEQMGKPKCFHYAPVNMILETHLRNVFCMGC